MEQAGKLFVVMGPSGAGKTTLVDAVLERRGQECKLTMVTPYTTRAPRPGEVHGQHFNFLTNQEFEQKIHEGFFLEWSGSYNAYYGTSAEGVAHKRSQGWSVVLVIDRAGAVQVKKQLFEAYVILIVPPSFEILQQRLQGRCTDCQETIAFRLERALEELGEEFKHPIASCVVENSEKELGIAQLETILCAGS